MRDLCLETRGIYDLIWTENRVQLDKWGIQNHEPAEWLMFATEELGELAEAIGEFKYRGGLVEPVVKEAIQTATLCLKIAEMFQDLLVKSGFEGK
jgi:hypothetical protein